VAQSKRFTKEIRASQESSRLAASVHPAERIKSISRLKFSKKNIQNSGSSGRLKESGTAPFSFLIVQDVLQSFVAFTRKFATCLIASAAYAISRFLSRFFSCGYI